MRLQTSPLFCVASYIMEKRAIASWKGRMSLIMHHGCVSRVHGAWTADDRDDAWRRETEARARLTVERDRGRRQALTRSLSKSLPGVRLIKSIAVTRSPSLGRCCTISGKYKHEATSSRKSSTFSGWILRSGVDNVSLRADR